MAIVPKSGASNVVLVHGGFVDGSGWRPVFESAYGPRSPTSIPRSTGRRPPAPVDAMRVVDGKITEHWGVATLLDLMQQLGIVPPLGRQR
jgi:hypothetical protein